MIYCVRFAEVQAALIAAGLVLIGETETTLIYDSPETALSIRKPGVNGTIPEIYVQAAFDAAELPIPDLILFWSD